MHGRTGMDCGTVYHRVWKKLYLSGGVEMKYRSFRGDLLRSMRERQGISRRVLSELRGFGPDTIRKYESGEREPGLRNLIAIAKYFGVPIEYFMEE